jgi:GDPmannose 4,6-dehydratase
VSRTHLVTGVTGQDGVLLARLLRTRGDRVVGTVLPERSEPPLARYLAGVDLVPLDVRDRAGFASLVERVRPDAVHNLAAVSSVGDSWAQPELAEAVNHTAVCDMLEVIRDVRDRTGQAPSFIQASSAEIFGPAGSGPVEEDARLAPASPYAEAKAGAHRAVAQARSEGVAATNLVLFGHTSPLHDPRFVLRSISQQAAEVALGRRAEVTLRDPSTERDWGAAVDFVRAFAAAVDGPPGDYVIATGQLHTLTEVTAWAMDALGLTVTPPRRSGEPARKTDFGGVTGCADRASEVLGWKPETPLATVIAGMARVDLRRLESGVDEDPAYLDEGAG